MSKKSVRWISGVVVGLFALSLFVAPSPVSSSGGEGYEEPVEQGEEFLPMEEPSLPQSSEVLGLEKIDPALRDLAKSGHKEMVEVVLIVSDVSAVARALEKYEYRGLVGEKATIKSVPTPIVLEVPANALAELAAIDEVLLIGKQEVFTPDVMDVPEEVVGGEVPLNLLRGDQNEMIERAAKEKGIKLDPVFIDSPSGPMGSGGPQPMGEDPPTPNDWNSVVTHMADLAWANGFTGAGEVVAVLDQGIDFGHSDLDGTWAVQPASTTIENITVIEAVGGETTATLVHMDVTGYSFYLNGVFMPPADYTFDPATGVITFTTALVLNDVVTATYTYSSPYAGWPITFEPPAIDAYLSNEGELSGMFVDTSTELASFTNASGTYITYNRDAPLMVPFYTFGEPVFDDDLSPGFPGAFLTAAYRFPFAVPVGTVQMNIWVEFTPGDDLDLGLFYDANGDDDIDLSELVAYEDTSTGDNPEVFAPIFNPNTENDYILAILGYTTSNPTDADIYIEFISIVMQDTDYDVTGISSASGVYHAGLHWDSWLSAAYFMAPALIVVDSTSPGVYDTVYVDLDNNLDFTDDMSATKGSPNLWKDLDSDGYADISGGLLYFISDSTAVLGEQLVVGNETMITGTTAIGGETWGQLANGDVTVSDVVNVLKNTLSWNTVDVVSEVVIVAEGLEDVVSLKNAKVVEESETLTGTDINVTDELSFTVSDPAADTGFEVANDNLLDLTILRKRASDVWFGPVWTTLATPDDYSANLATGQVTFTSKLTNNPNPLEVNMAEDEFYTWYNYTGVMDTSGYTVDYETGEITLTYQLKTGAEIRADYTYYPWILDVVTGNFTFTNDLQAGDELTVDYSYGVVPIPYSDILAGRLGVDNYYWGAGDMVAFTGATYGSHGTAVATSIVGQGVTPIGGTPKLMGLAPDAKVISIPGGVSHGSFTQYHGFLFAIEGYDGVPGTGDEGLVISWSFGSNPLESGWTVGERFGDWVTTQYSEGKTIHVKSAGNEGGGYGTTGNSVAPGTISTCAAWDLFYRVQPEHLYDGGPNPAYGGVAYLSSWGPAATGQLGPDICFNGAWAYDAYPINEFMDGTAAWNIDAGTSMAAPHATAVIALMQDAYEQTYGHYMDAFEAQRILLSSADDMNYDVFTQGSGYGNALRATNLASNSGGILANPEVWYPGDYRGQDYVDFVHFLTAGESDSEMMTVENRGSTPLNNVGVSADYLKRMATIEYTVQPTVEAPPEPVGNNWTIINETGFYDFFGRKFGPGMDVTRWNNADLLRITAHFDMDLLTNQQIYVEPHDWTDVNMNGRFFGHSANITAMDFCSDGTMFATGAEDGVIILWDNTTGYPIDDLAGLGGSMINDIDFTSDCSKLAASAGPLPFGGDGLVAVWDVATRARLVRSDDFLFGYTITGVEFNPANESQIAFTSSVNSALRWLNGLPRDYCDPDFLADVMIMDISGNLLGGACGHLDIVNTLAWSPDGSVIATGGGGYFGVWDNYVMLWDPITGTQVGGFSGHEDEDLSGDLDGVMDLKFSSDSMWLASVGMGSALSGAGTGTVNVWDMTLVPSTGYDTFNFTGAPVFTLGNTSIVPFSYQVWVDGTPVYELDLGSGMGDYILYTTDGLMFYLGPLPMWANVTIQYDYVPPAVALVQENPTYVDFDGVAMNLAVANATGVAIWDIMGGTITAEVIPTYDFDGFSDIGFSSGYEWFWAVSYGGEIDLWWKASGAMLVDPGLPYGVTGAWFERNRMGIFLGENSFEVRIHDPATRTHDGLIIWWRHLSGDPVPGPVTVTIEFFEKQPWPMVSLFEDNGVTPLGATISIPAGGTFDFVATATVPPSADVGLYEGAIHLTNGADITTIPIVINVAHEGSTNFQFGGSTTSDTLYDNNALRGYGGAYDLRYYFFDVPDTFVFKEGMKFIVDIDSDGDNTYADMRHLGQEREEGSPGLGDYVFSQLNESRYGPFVLAETDVGAPGYFKKTPDWTGAGNGLFKALSAGPGLNVLIVETTTVEGEEAADVMSGETGLLSMTPYPLDFSTNQLEGSYETVLSTTIPWLPNPDPFNEFYGKPVGVTVAGSEVSEFLDIPIELDGETVGDESFVEYLARSLNTMLWDVDASVITIEFHLQGHADCCPDMDLGVFLDANGDDQAQADEFVKYDADADADETVVLVLPAPGRYIITMAGFDVWRAGALADMTVTELSVGPSPFGVTYTADVVPAYSSEVLNLTWDLPEDTTTEGTIKAAFFASPGNAPVSLTLLVPVTLIYDITPPEVLQTLPADGSVMSDSTPAILAGFSDSIGTMDSTSISLWLDGVDITSMSVVSVTFDSDLGGYATGTVSYIPTAPLADGMHTVMTQVGDSAGNLEEFTWQFYVDTTIPLLQIDYPSTDTTITTDSVMITGTAESGATVAIRGEDVPVASDGTFSYMFDQLGEGANWLTVVAVDSVGNTATVTRLITVDTIPPDLEYPVITSEPLGKPTNAQTLTVTGKFSEIVELTIAGKEVPVNEDGTFETTIPLEEGVNTIVIEAHDAAGHTFTSNDTVITKDTVAPTLTASILAENIDPLTGEALVSIINVTGTVSSDVEIVTVNGLPVIPSQGAFSKEVTLSYGTNEITVIAKDEAGNTATRALSVTWSPEFEVTKQTWTTVILMALAVVLLIVGLLIGLMIGRRPTIEEEVFEEEIPPEEEEAVEEMPEEEEMLEEEPLEEIEMPEEEPPAEEVSPEEGPPEEPPEETTFPKEGEP
ncbi:MAG: S8 family serine peptidase [Candidatus Thermoplasmatota archaeon]|nr:S8 family serine peptidase [Candidatus Thermoplasmatota archaeon]